MNKKRLLLLVGVLALVPVTFLTASLTSRRSRVADTRQEAATNEPAAAAILALSSSQSAYRVGEEFTVDIRLDTGGGTVSAVQVRIMYEPSFLQILEVIPGRSINQDLAMLEEVLVSKAQANEGTVYLDQGVGLPGSQPYRNRDASHPGIYGRLRVKALAEGSTFLNLTGETAVFSWREGAPVDLLSTVHNLRLTIQPAGEPPSPPQPPPSPPPSPPTPEPPPQPPAPVCELEAKQEQGVGKAGLGPSFEYVAFTPNVSGRLEKVAIKAGGYGVGERRVICKITDKDKRDLTPEASSLVFRGEVADWREVSFGTLTVTANTPYQLACRGSETWSGTFWVLDWAEGRTYRIFICH